MQAVSNMTIVTLASPTNYSTEGQTITYNYVVTNTGNVNIKGPITITDNKTNPVHIDIDLAPGRNVTGTATYNITQADLDTGYVANLASATGTYNETEVKSNTDTVKIVADTQIPEFPSIVLPVVAILGIVFILQRNRKEE